MLFGIDQNKLVGTGVYGCLIVILLKLILD